MISKRNLDSLGDEELFALYAWPEGSSLRLSMLIGSTGSPVGADGTSHSLTTSSDRRVLKAVRRDADYIIVGAASVRAEGWFLPKQGELLVLSGSADLPWDSCPSPERVVVCASLDGVLEYMRAHPGRYLCDGGLTTANLLDGAWGFSEIALTSHCSPIAALSLVTNNPEAYELSHSLAGHGHDNDSEVFSLWRRAARSMD